MKKIQDNIVRFIDGANDDIKSLPNIVSSSTESQKRIEKLNTFVEDVMVKGVDYGLINGFSSLNRRCSNLVQKSYVTCLAFLKLQRLLIVLKIGTKAHSLMK